ncbi:YcaO-like family protein [Streptomyces wuyuanensis]|uniref:Ribosomal protein S12 methylthiotransferase accessory factor n=1 Tax=Streptomyces wuyuanensis TaxID=1196353 RepID=A0A1G9VKS3_9ACTN|nr:YcaO-like family protein [Streptomyces wuyuanensis]SDM72707.1 ribosomal protein S12 methylthiotransferase accessory factor [Streptomyces wuyuanensis]
MHVNRHQEYIPDELRRLEELVSPYGLVSRTSPLPVREGEPPFAVHLSHLGVPSRALSNLRTWAADEDTGNSDGAGTGLTPERARLLSIAEALERYSTCAWDDGEMVVAAENDLTEEFASPSRWPRCSPTELDRDDCRLSEYDPSVPIRWVRAWSLTRQVPVLVPAISVYLHMPYFSESEKFTRGITTGAAVHSDVRAAVLGGLLEVVERDSIALVWLQRLRLPELVVDPEQLSAGTRALHRVGTSTDLRVRLFDATTDFGVPVIYAVQLADADPTLAQIVAATCDVRPEGALGKIYRELSSLRVALRGYVSAYAGREPDLSQVSVVGGAVHNASSERRGVFDFLLEGERPAYGLDGMPSLPAEADPLDTVVSRLASRGAEVLVADITTDEARQVGMRAVKVLVPEAMPVSFVHGERYLGTPRLYKAPHAMGHTSHAEDALNPEPQAFA